MAKLLVTRPDFDIATRYLSTYGGQLIQQAQAMGFDVTDLYGDNATNENFEAAMPNNDLLIGCGHGNTNIFTGRCIQLGKDADGLPECNNFDVLLQSGVNTDLLAGKKCYLISCLTGVSLGPDLVTKGCPEFYGFQADFVFIYNAPNYDNNDILGDPYAQPVFDSALTTAYAILAGKAPIDVFNDTIARYDYWYDYWHRQNDPMGEYVMSAIQSDRQRFLALTPTSTFEVPNASALGLILPLAFATVLLLMLSRE